MDEKGPISMAHSAEYNLVAVHGQCEFFMAAVTAFGSPEKVVQKAAREKYSMFGNSGLNPATHDAQMVLASKRYPELLFEESVTLPGPIPSKSKSFFLGGEKVGDFTAQEFLENQRRAGTHSYN
jgi:hypothetical protein